MPDASHLHLVLSGGGANTDPEDSLGGAKSSQALFSQTVTFSVPIAGITVAYAGGLPVGESTLSFVASGDLLSLRLFGDVSYGPAVNVGTSGTYTLEGASGGCLIVTVNASATPTSSTIVGTFQVANNLGNLFDDILGSEARLGKVEYRCIYMGNNHPTDAMASAGVVILSQPTAGDLLAVGLDPIGKGDGIATGVATVIATESEAPVGVTFTTPTDPDLPLAITGGLAAGEYQAVWVRRTVPVNTVGNAQQDTSVLGFTMVSA